MKMIKISFAVITWLFTTTIGFAQNQKYGCSSEVPKQDHISFIEDTTKMGKRGLADNYYLWDNGKTIYVRFLTGSKDMQDKIKAIAKEWEKYANIHFEFVYYGASNIRINLDNKGGHNSMIGTLANNAGENEKTMNFDTTDFRTYDAMYRTVLHEFGHAIGLLHEHYSPTAGIQWNKQTVYDELKRTQGWDKETVDANLFQQYKLSYTNGTKYDKTSIMHYPIMARWTTNGYNVNWNNKLSEGDIALIGLLYPKTSERVDAVPRFAIENFTNIAVVKNSAKQGISVYPSFNIKTAGKKGTVYFIVFFYDKDGNALKKETQSYSINNMTATFKSFTLAPDKRLSANKESSTDFELFIPYNELPLPTGNNNVQVEFRAYLLDETAEGNELKMLYASKRVPFSFLKTK